MKTASRQTRNIRIIVALIAVALALSAVVVYELGSMQKGETIISGSVIVVADNYNATSFYTPAGANIYISGSFSAQIASPKHRGDWNNQSPHSQRHVLRAIRHRRKLTVKLLLR